jgi:hypothetical protein
MLRVSSVICLRSSIWCKEFIALDLTFFKQALHNVGYTVGRSISTAISAGSALAFTSAVIDFAATPFKHDEGKEYAALTTKKRPSNNA